MQTNDKLLPTSAALAYLAEVWGFKRSPITLSKWASAGTGPPFRKLGRFKYYAPVDLDPLHRLWKERARPRPRYCSEWTLRHWGCHRFCVRMVSNPPGGVALGSLVSVLPLR
jgi:hypothetical protein